MNDAQLIELLKCALISANAIPPSNFLSDEPIESIGLDSLGLSETIFFVESKIGSDISSSTLEALSEVKSVRQFYEVFRNALESNSI